MTTNSQSIQDVENTQDAQQQQDKNESGSGTFGKLSHHESKPLWAQFAIALADKIARAGIVLERDDVTDSGLPENKGWVRLEHRASGTKLYVPKGKTRLSHLETSIDLKPNSERGVLRLPQPKNGNPYENGAIRSHLEADHGKAAVIFIEAIEAGVVKPAKRISRGVLQQLVVPVLADHDDDEESEDLQMAGHS